MKEAQKGSENETSKRTGGGEDSINYYVHYEAVRGALALAVQ